jgi:hypothetical protein
MNNKNVIHETCASDLSASGIEGLEQVVLNTLTNLNDTVKTRSKWVRVTHNVAALLEFIQVKSPCCQWDVRS